MKKLNVLKGASTLAVSVGVQQIVSSAIRTTAVMPVHPILKGCFLAGSFALSCMISDKATDYTGEQFDGALEFLEDVGIGKKQVKVVKL